jgi:hypothetical protein
MQEYKLSAKKIAKLQNSIIYHASGKIMYT